MSVSVNRKTIVLANICVIAMIVVLSTSVVAAKWECGERSNLSPEGKNYCAAGDFRQSDAELAKVFGDLVEKHQSAYGDASALSNAQSAFKSYRDNHCAAANTRIKDKPFHPMVVAQCKNRLTNLRIDELKRMQYKD